MRNTFLWYLIILNKKLQYVGVFELTSTSKYVYVRSLIRKYAHIWGENQCSFKDRGIYQNYPSTGCQKHLNNFSVWYSDVDSRPWAEINSWLLRCSSTVRGLNSGLSLGVPTKV